MIHRSFKPAKCKTELKLAISRIKLMKNKRGAQLKQLKTEVAQLLVSGQIQNAKIRVEHVVKEEKTMAAYELIEVYCELIAARMSIIESQKNCPIDLKEPICGVIFASPRCAEIPELRKVSKQLTRKYGKEFLSAAVELRPDCGVNRLLVDKLSAKGPDSETKLKTLSAIAEEQNIKWDPQQLEDKNSNRHNDLLNGHATAEQANDLQKGPSHGQAPHSHYKKEKFNISPSLQNKMNMDPAEILNNYDARWSLGSRNAAAQSGVSKPLPSESMLSGSQNGKMEFKDAASAAQAAVESAELASIAARAAAELSGLGTNTGQGSSVLEPDPHHHARDEGTQHGARYAQSETSDLAAGHDDFERSDSAKEGSGKNNEAYFAVTPEKIKDGPGINRSSSMNSQSTSMESSTCAAHDDYLKPPHSHIKNRMMHLNCDSCLQDEELAKDPTNSTLNGESVGTIREQFVYNELHKAADVSEDSRRAIDRFHYSASMKSIQDHTSVSSPGNTEQADSFPPYFVPESCVSSSLDEKERNFREFEEEISTERQEGLSYENNDDIKDRQFREESSDSFNSHSKGPSIDLNYDFPTSGERETIDVSVEDPFTCFDDEKLKEDFLPEYSTAPVVFDDYYSDGDGDIFDLNKGPETGLLNSSPGRKFPTCLSTHSNPSNPGGASDDFPGMDTSLSHLPQEIHSHSVVSEDLADSRVLSKLDEELAATFDDVRGDSESEDRSNEGNKLSCERPQDASYAKLPTTFSDIRGDSESEDRFNEENRLSCEPPQDVSYAEFPAIGNKQTPSFSSMTDQFSDDEEKGYIHAHPPDSSSVMEPKNIISTPEKPHTLDDTETSEESISGGHVELNLEKLTGGLKHKHSRNSPYKISPARDVDQVPFETIVHSSIPKPEPISSIIHGEDADYQKVSAKVKNERGPTTRNRAVGSKKDDGSRSLPQKSLKGDPDSYYKKSRSQVNKKSSTTSSANFFDSTDGESDSNAAQKVSPRKTQAPTKLSWRTKDVPSESHPGLKSKHVSKESSPPLHDPKTAGPSSRVRLESPVQERRSNVHATTATSVKTEGLVTQQNPSRESSIRKPRHVHPKLPDYDELAAHLQSLRTDKALTGTAQV